MNAAVSDNIVKLINVSFSLCELTSNAFGEIATEDQEFKQAILQGQTFVVSAGDVGSNSCSSINDVGQSYPASSPYVVAVGGTALSTNGTNWSNETVWNDNEGATGGGPSVVEPQPIWQLGVGQNAGQANRGVPDVAFDAGTYSPMNVYNFGYFTPNSGTSLAAPIFVGGWARVMAADGDLGFAAPLIYTLPKSAFHDVILGNNNGQNAAPGWDYTTGFGSMIFSEVAVDLAASGSGKGSAPTAQFSYSTNGLFVNYTDASTDPGGILSTHEWDLGDGQRAHIASPPHKYDVAGTYTVTETVTDSVSKTTSYLTENVTVPSTPTAYFTYLKSGLTVTFIDGSIDPGSSISTYDWDLEDGQHAHIASPPHTYGVAGTYIVTETVTDGASGKSSRTTSSVTVP